MIIRHVLISVIMLMAISGQSQEYVSGKIITNKLDTIACSLLKLKRGESKLRYIEVDVVDSSRKTIKYRPNEIEGYIKEGVFYKSLTIDDRSIFVCQLVDGNVSLYLHEGARGDEYFFKRISEPHLNMLNLANQTIRKIIGVDGMVTMKGHSIDLYVINKNHAFMDYFTEYFKDCPILVNKIKSEFYSSADMKDIFIEYNKYCKK